MSESRARAGSWSEERAERGTSEHATNEARGTRRAKTMQEAQ
ncbi:MAG TPA: hypothetical protein VF069_29860 [Streptosporangiaceae bacterium]